MVEGGIFGEGVHWVGVVSDVSSGTGDTVRGESVNQGHDEHNDVNVVGAAAVEAAEAGSEGWDENGNSKEEGLDEENDEDDHVEVQNCKKNNYKMATNGGEPGS